VIVFYFKKGWLKNYKLEKYLSNIRKLFRLMIVGIILAAGESKRFVTENSSVKENKLLYEIVPGISVIEKVLSSFLHSQIDKVVIVIGFQNDKILHKIEPLIESTEIKVEAIYNPNFRAGGMSSSIIKGMEIAMDAEAVLITPADIPFISTQVINDLIKRIKIKKPEIIIPACNNRKGHPIAIRSSLFSEILAISEKNRGLKGITKKYAEKIEYLKLQDEGILYDLDTKSDLMKFK
jgi:molybdenum cofactor cytidylyltransferase